MNRNNSSKEKSEYLTKRRLISASNKGIQSAAKKTLELRGFNIIAEGGWIVRKYADGRIEQISPITKSTSKLAFD